MRRVYSTAVRQLLSDPLQPSRIAKTQVNKQFAAPQLVSFDLWNTLYTPKKPVHLQYHDISSKYVDKSAESIEHDFAAVHRAMLTEHPNYGRQSLADFREWWLELIVRLYKIPRNETAHRLCDELIAHFSSKDAYTLYDDVVPTLEYLASRNIAVVASSNSDERAVAILESLGIAHFFAGVHLSYDLGVEKPHRAFFQQVAREHRVTALERAWHVGDSYESDFVGAIKSGWNGVLLDRGRSSVFFKHARQERVRNDCFEGQAQLADTDEMVLVADNRVAVTGLAELTQLWGLTQ